MSKAWNDFLNVLSLRTTRALQGNTERALRTQLGLLRRDIYGYIDSERHGVPNSPLTILIKGSSRPLVDRGDLRNVSIRVERRGETLAGGVGVLRTARTRAGAPLFNVAIALHDGYVVRVTAKVRAAVFAEMRKRRGKKVRFTGGSGARVWVVKGRPFIRAPFEAAEARIRVALGDAVRVTLLT